jgi:hypothetical protein
MTKESLESTLTTSLTLMLGLATLDIALFIWVGTAVVTVVAHAMSLWLFIRYRLVFDLVKLFEASALMLDLYLINMYGYAVASPVATLFAIIRISLNKNHHLAKLKNDLDKVLASKQKDVENDKK